jgi:hypothetical protein
MRRPSKRFSHKRIGFPLGQQIPVDPAEHAEDFAHRYADRLEQYCALRMEALGIPVDKNGAPDFDRDGRWRAFDPTGRSGGNIASGVYLNSGVLDPELLKGKGSRLWPKTRLRDRIDAIIAHEWEEDRHGTHEAAVAAAPKTDLPISDHARRMCPAMAW